MKDTAVIVSQKLNPTAAAREIREQHTTVIEHMTDAALHACQAGDLLLLMKAQLKHGEWQPWVKRHCPFLSLRTAQEYMRLAETVPKTQRAAVLKGRSLRQGLKLLKPPREPSPKPTLETLSTRTAPRGVALDDGETVEVGSRDPGNPVARHFEYVKVIIRYLDNFFESDRLEPLEELGHDCAEARATAEAFRAALVRLIDRPEPKTAGEAK